MGRVFLDSEFNSSSEPNMNVLCFSLIIDHDGTTTKHNIWTQDEEGVRRLHELVESCISDGHVFIAFAVTAEARALHSLGIDPMRIPWIDLQIEYRMLASNNNRVRCGKHLVDGKIKTLKPPLPKWDQPDGYSTGGGVTFSLASCIYRFLGIRIDVDHKNDMRSLILDNMEWSGEERRQIMDYCMSDVVHLPRLTNIMMRLLWSQYLPADRRDLRGEMVLRGQYAALSAIMEAKGYPVALEEMKNFSASVGEIKAAMQRSIVQDFPEVNAFAANKSGTKYVQKTKPIREWVASQGHPNWLKTEKGELSLSLDAFERYYSSRGDKTNFGNRFTKFLREKQALNGFTDNTTKATIWDSTGSDGRVRPYMGIYRAQTSRSQPKATAYIPLKASWMRYLIQPPEGKVIIAIDYSQQEFLLAGLVSQDRNMISAYHSGDPYLAFAIQAGGAPKGATKKTHSEIRDRFKSSVLGIQFGMGAKGLASKISQDTGEECSEEDAQDLINSFYEVYADFKEWREETWDVYRSMGYLKLRDGWTIWGDNPNMKSVLNFPIQGFGASIMRRGVYNCYRAGLPVIMTLHDALYCEVDKSKVLEGIDTLAECMGEAVTHYFQDTPMEEFAHCRMDPQAWGYGFEEGEIIQTSIGPMPCQPRYISGRTRPDIERFKSFFLPDDLADFI